MRDRSTRVDSRTGSVSDPSNEIDELTKEINEDTSEHRRIMKIFDNAMTDFASDRSLEMCLEALNTSIQMANIRHKLFLSFKHYSELLEKEVIRLAGQSHSGPHE